MRVCISGCCWCGDRCEQVGRRDPDWPDLGGSRVLLLPEYVAEPCGHPVNGQIVKRDDGHVVVTLYPPWEQVPHMHLATPAGTLVSTP